MDLSQPGSIAQRESALEELEAFERRWWWDTGGWKRKTHITFGEPLNVLFALREAQQAVTKHGAAVAQAHGVGVQEQRAALFRAALQNRFGAEEFYLYQIYQDARRRAIRSFIPKERMIVLLEYLVGKTLPPDRKALQDKRLFREHGERHGLPTIPVLAEFDNGEATPRAWHPDEALPGVDVFAKAANRWCGVDARRWIYAGESMFRDDTGKTFASREIVAEMRQRSSSGPQVLQPRVRNHRALDRLSRGGLCTVRLVTCRRPGDGGGFDYLPPVLRMPTGDSVVDNFAQGGLAAPIDAHTGKLGAAAICRNAATVITRATHHPDTQQQLEGFELPFWPEALALGLRAHTAFPSMQCIGWDIALLDSGPVLVEGNVIWDSDLTQLPHGVGLADTQFVAYYNQHVRAISAPK